MKRESNKLDEPTWSDRLSLKIALTIGCVIVGAIGILYLTGVL